MSNLVRLVLLLGLVAAASFLPPDTSLRRVKEAGLLRVCVPVNYPPLVTGDMQMPGLDVELVRAIAEKLNVRTFLAVSPAIGSSYDPRSWNVTRSQCQVLAGGTVDTVTTRSFLQVTPNYLTTGWALVTADGSDLREGMRIAVYFSNVNFNRIELSRFLRERRVEAAPVRSVEQAERALASGEVEGLLMEALTASQVVERNEWEMELVSDELSNYPIVLGLWKGDITLKRAVVGAIDELETSGQLDRLRDRYGLRELEAEL